jgi:5-formyltetrahydrofolate cyclo-ligase
MSIELTKKQIRSKILLRLKTQKEEDRDKKSWKIKNKLFKTAVFKKAKVIMFYVSFDGEVRTREMIKKAQQLGKKVVVPICGKNRIINACLLKDKARFIRGPYGTREPVIKECVDLRHLDLVIVPGVAFTKEGKRLGRGKGFYDRFLKELPLRTVSVGLAFDFQILPDIPATPNDVSVNKVIYA